MPTYSLASKDTEGLLSHVIEQYHDRLINADVRVGILMAFATVDPETGEKKGHAIKGYAGAAAGAQVKKVSAKDRLTKKYDVELLIDGDEWPNLPEPQKIAMLDHEMTHIQTTDKVDDNNRPLVKMRDEDFIVWGFLEVVQRHGTAAMEHRSLKSLIDHHGNLLLGLDGDCKDAAPPTRSGLSKVTIKTGEQSYEISGEGFAKVGEVAKKLRRGGDKDLSPTGREINTHRRKRQATTSGTRGGNTSFAATVANVLDEAGVKYERNSATPTTPDEEDETGLEEHQTEN